MTKRAHQKERGRARARRGGLKRGRGEMEAEIPGVRGEIMRKGKKGRHEIRERGAKRRMDVKDVVIGGRE